MALAARTGNQQDQPKLAVIVSKNKEHVDVDQAALKRLSLELAKVFPAGAQAFHYLAAHPCDVILCDSDIDDFDSRTFLKIVKNNPSLRNIPVVMVTADNQRDAVLDAVAAGCSGYILRPYVLDTFERHVNTALQLVRFNEIENRQLRDAQRMMEGGDYDAAIEEFKEVVSLKNEAQKFYDLGCSYLNQEKYGKAIVAFQKAVKMNEMYAEAYQGLSEAYKRKGDLEQCQFYLKKAADVYAESDHLEKVKELFIDILKFDHAAANPFNTMGVKLRKSGDYAAAIRAYDQALELTPNDENIYFNMAKALYFKGDKAACVEKLVMALSMNPSFLEALRMYRKLTGKRWPVNMQPRPSSIPTGESMSQTIKDI